MTTPHPPERGSHEVALVNLPFGNVLSPSFGLSLLVAGLRRAGIRSRVHYFTFGFARLVGASLYRRICDGSLSASGELPGEWIFARALFGRRARGPRGVAAHALRETGRDARGAALRRARRLAPGFLDACAGALLSERPRLVGFTSVFQQHVAALALAERLKRADPSLFVVFGGANCEGPMGAETLRQFPWVDALVSGEADLVFPELVRRVLAREPLRDLPGVVTQASIARDFAHAAAVVAPPVMDMDALPDPDYSDFFEQFAESGFARRWQARIFFESSRGCWWGAKHHCTFCGLNGQTMEYRSKSPRRAADELLRLAARHPQADVQVVDNILDLRYFDTLLPELAARGAPLDLFYETKSNLDRRQVELLRAAGVRSIQPGIESFSDSVLRLMRKGVSGLQNIQLLRFCHELGVRPYWNVLWGFPGEDPGEYARLAALVPLLVHLPPPTSCAGLRLDRFSPNFTQAAALGFVDVRPLRSYGEIYPLPDEALFNLAYHFCFGYADGRNPATYVRPLLRAVRAWRRAHARSALVRVDCGEQAALIDLRPCAQEILTVLGPVEAALYRDCDAVRGVSALARSSGLEADVVTARLEPLVARGLLLRDGTRYLALALSQAGERENPPARTRRRVRALELESITGAAGLRVAPQARRAGALRWRRGGRRAGFELPHVRVEGAQVVLTGERSSPPAGSGG